VDILDKLLKMVLNHEYKKSVQEFKEHEYYTGISARAILPKVRNLEEQTWVK